MSEIPRYVNILSVSTPIRDVSEARGEPEDRLGVWLLSPTIDESFVGVGDAQHITFEFKPTAMKPGERLTVGTLDRTVCDGVVLFSRQPLDEAPKRDNSANEIVSIIHAYPGQRPFVDRLIREQGQHHFPAGRRGVLVISRPSERQDSVAYASSLQSLVDEVTIFTRGDNPPPDIITTIPGNEIQHRIDSGEGNLVADILFVATREKRFVGVPLTDDEIEL